MSSDATQSALSRAYELVEAGKFDEARAILDPILAANRNNADAWWVYAHAVTNAEDGHAALENVVRISPNYPGAAELLAQAREVAAPSSSAPKPRITKLSTQTGAMPAAPTHLPEGDFAEAEAADSTQERRAAAPASRGGLPLIPILAVIVIFILVALFLVSQGNKPAITTPTSIPTQVIAALATPTSSIAQAATAEITAAVVLPTVSPLAVTETVTAEVSAESSAGNFAAIESALSQFPLAESGVGEVQTSLGNTLQVTVCATAGRTMRTLLPQVMNALAKQSSTLDVSVQAISAHLIDCTKNAPLVTVAVDVATAQSYAAGKLTDTAFAATWKPQ